MSDRRSEHGRKRGPSFWSFSVNGQRNGGVHRFHYDPAYQAHGIVVYIRFQGVVVDLRLTFERLFGVSCNCMGQLKVRVDTYQNYRPRYWALLQDAKKSQQRAGVDPQNCIATGPR